MDFRGKSAVITGGGSGIGEGLARELARQGAAVAVADLFLEKARAVADKINAEGGTALALYCDVCDRSSIEKMRQEATAALGPVQLVFANAGATSFQPLLQMPVDDIDWIVQVNLMGVMHTVREFLPQMIASGGGHICATASMAGLLPAWIPTHAPYSAAKAGVIALMMNLALELKPHNIYTTSYCPAGVASGMKANNGSYRPARFGGPATGDVVVDPASAISSLRFYRPEAVAPIVLDAVRKRRPFVFDHAEQRRLFTETYSGIVEACYDDIEAWELEHGVPQANPTGAALLQCS